LQPRGAREYGLGMSDAPLGQCLGLATDNNEYRPLHRPDCVAVEAAYEESKIHQWH
jgi:hypothetical protein